jgi:capsular polysaccharide export protein
MDGYQATDAIEPTSGHRAALGPAMDGKRSFLLLQGPISGCFDRLGRALIARGHRVHRINLHFGDQLFWRLPATHFRGRFADWRGFVADVLEQHEITDLVLHGDRRPYHIVAAEEARARGIAVIVTDLGYVRPDWITLEYDGMTTYSRFPRDPAVIPALAAKFPEPELGPRFHTPFWLIAMLDVAYNLALVFGRPLYPHYRYHSICHPFAEYAGWLRSRAKRWFTARATVAEKCRLQVMPGSYFLVPLQLSTDFQIRAHSPFCDEREAVREIVASFAASGSRKKLVFVVHPLDNGLIGWSRLIARLARHGGVAEQVIALPGGTPAELLRNAAGVVTINSTVGVAALQHGVPVKVLGNAVFDIAGLTCRAPLDAFWRDPPPPDPGLMADFLRALIGTTQVKGGYYERASQACAVDGIVERLERRPYALPALSAADLAARPPRASSRTAVVTGVSDAIGAALARASAEPGTRLYLIGGMTETLDKTAEDCRQRGALVETFCRKGSGPSALADYLRALDRRDPVDALLVHAGPAEPAEGPVVERSIDEAMSVVAAIGEPMRRRGCGEIVLVSLLAGRAATGDPRTALRTSKAFAAYGADLRQRLRAAGVAVVVVRPGSLAIRAAARLREPLLATVGADHLAELTLRGLHRRRALIAVPGCATLAMRTLRLVTSRMHQSARTLLVPSADAIGEPDDQAGITGKSAPRATGATGN